MKEFDSELAVEVMREYGAMSLPTWAKVCIQRGVFTDEFKAKAVRRQAISLLRKFSGQCDDTGLPRYGQTTRKEDETGKSIYAQPDLWSRADTLLHIQERLQKRDGNHVRVLQLVEYFEDRFGEECPLRPSLDRLPGLEYADAGA